MKSSKPFRFPPGRPLKPSALIKVYRRLRRAFGHQHWWPAESPFEVMAGAILTQNTAWLNVERAIQNLKDAAVLDPHRMHDLPHRKLADLIRPAGYFNVKARRLMAFLDYFIGQYHGRVEVMRRRRLADLRDELLTVHGIGEETADSILLYALGKPTFVIDAYTRRIFARHRALGLPQNTPQKITPNSRIYPMALWQTGYGPWKALFEASLPRQTGLFKDFHAQIVAVGKRYCRPQRPLCEKCPLKIYL